MLTMPRTLAVTDQWQPEWKRGLVYYHHWYQNPLGYMCSYAPVQTSLQPNGAEQEARGKLSW